MRLLRYILSFSFVFCSLGSANCCEFDMPTYRYLIMNPDIVDNYSWWNFIYYSEPYYGDFFQSDADERRLSKEWKTKLKLKSSENAIFLFLFDQKSDSTHAIDEVKKELKTNQQFKAFIDFAEKCTALSSNEFTWDSDEINIDSLNLLRQKTFAEGFPLLQNQTNDFWKKKYAFQLLKICFYASDHAKFNALYQNYFNVENRSTLDWWALHYKAMMLESLGRTDSANYLHAQVFSNSSSKMHESLRWFTSKNLESQALLCKNEDELGNLYLIAAINDYDISIDNIKKAYSYKPNHPLMLLALNREMNKIESDVRVNTHPIYSTWYNSLTETDAMSGIAADATNLYSVVKQMKVLENSHPDYYHLLMSELSIMIRNVVEAQSHLNQIKKRKGSIQFQKQVLSTMLVCITKDLSKVATQDLLKLEIDKLLVLRKDVFESEQILNSLFKYMADAFINKKMIIHGYLLSNFADSYLPGESWNNGVISGLDGMSTAPYIEQLITFKHKPNKSELEKLISHVVPNEMLLKELLGTVYMRNLKLEDAKKAFNSVPEDDWAWVSSVYLYMDENPFVLSHTKVYSREYVAWNKSEMVDSLVALENYKTKSLKEYRLLGNIWFNITKFGNSWYLMSDYYDSNMSRCVDDDYYGRDGSLTWNKVYKTCLTKSLGYYTKALPLAKEQEVQAEITYMICWCYFLLDKIDLYAAWAGKYEQMKATEFYKGEKCTFTPLYDERKLLESIWISY